MFIEGDEISLQKIHNAKSIKKCIYIVSVLNENLSFA